MIEKCNTCHCAFADQPDGDPLVLRQSLSNRHYLATVDETGQVLAECCESCAQEAAEETGHVW